MVKDLIVNEVDMGIVHRSNEEIGYIKQEVVCMEELSELIVAAEDYYFSADKDRVDNLLEEIADVIVCSCILQDIFSIHIDIHEYTLTDNYLIIALMIKLCAYSQKAISKVIRERVKAPGDIRKEWKGVLGILDSAISMICEGNGLTHDEVYSKLSTIIHEKQARTLRRLNKEEF
jgi:hypothetical protein